MLIRLATVVLGISGLIFFGSGLQAAPTDKSDSVVKTAVNAGKVRTDGKQVIEVELTIKDKWHLYANPVLNDELLECQVILTATAGGKPIDAKVTYPVGKVARDAVIKGTFYIYEGKVSIKVAVDRTKLGSGPIDLKIKVAACNDINCLLPADIKLQVP